MTTQTDSEARQRARARARQKAFNDLARNHRPEFEELFLVRQKEMGIADPKVAGPRADGARRRLRDLKERYPEVYAEIAKESA